MKRPWQFWTIFVIGLAIVLPAMGWLTFKALELDRAEAESRRNEAIARLQSEQYELISSALWRMDLALIPVVAQEAARPYYLYQPFYSAPAGKGTKGQWLQEPSPLLVQPSEYVLLHFQLDQNDAWTSPQSPVGPLEKVAIQNGAAKSNIIISAKRLTQLQETVNRKQMLAMLPIDSLPAIDISPYAWAGNTSLNFNNDSLASNKPGIVNTLGLEQVDQQVKEVQENQEELPQQQGGKFPTDYQPGNPNQAQPQAQNPQAANNPRQQFLRGGNEFQRRNRAQQNYGLQQIVQQRVNNKQYTVPQQPKVKEGVSTPIWMGKNLLLSRRIWQGERVTIQGCWLDWDKIKKMLLTEVDDLLPNADLVPVTANSEVNLTRQLATLPVQLVIPGSSNEFALPLDNSFSSIKMSLIVAWVCLLLATGATAILLQGVMTLSERRGAFVSAVTHELRTPLTTFRMYAEMLSGGMVKEEEKQQQYLETLRIESDRLAHLVENVLAYARLERGKPGRRRETIVVADLLDRMQSRLQDRATQAEMQFAVEVDDRVAKSTVNTDPGAVEQIIFNLVDNACKYALAAKDRHVHLEISSDDQSIEFRVRDHGPGISDRGALKLFRPFSKSVHEAADTAPGVGLGLALSRRLATALGGRLEMRKTAEQGATFVLNLPTS